MFGLLDFTMKTTRWLVLGLGLMLPLGALRAQTGDGGSTAVTASAGVGSLSAGAAEVLKLASAGTSEDVILAYIRNVQLRFGLTADNIVYLKDLGVSPAVIAAMLNRDGELRAAQPAAVSSAPAPVTTTAPLVAPQPETTTTVATVAPAPATTTVYVSNPPAEVAYFYSDLSPYGSWVQLEGYGWCWQPTVVTANPGWRPYCDSGHWVYTDAGWYWMSDYSWGWAPFHYGRWSHHPRCGWVWLPDRVWGPAWVTWRVGDAHCGWAPLPPHAELDVALGWRFNGVRVGVDFDFGLGIDLFTFVSVGDFCRSDLGHHRLPPHEVAPIFHGAHVVNTRFEHDLVVNHGIATERIVAVTHAPVRRMEIRDVPAGSPRDFRGGGQAVYRAPLREPARAVEMHAQRVDDRHPVIQHSVGGTQPARAEQPARVSQPHSTPSAVAPSRNPAPAIGGGERNPSASPGRSSSPATGMPNGAGASSSKSGPPQLGADGSFNSGAMAPSRSGSTPSSAVGGLAHTGAGMKGQFTPKVSQPSGETHSAPSAGGRGSSGGPGGGGSDRGSGRGGRP
jgi:hypothetical protein